MRYPKSGPTELHINDMRSFTDARKGKAIPTASMATRHATLKLHYRTNAGANTKLTGAGTDTEDPARVNAPEEGSIAKVTRSPEP
jgi:hypothetical protein